MKVIFGIVNSGAPSWRLRGLRVRAMPGPAFNAVPRLPPANGIGVRGARGPDRL
jgi:hypothetical protein